MMDLTIQCGNLFLSLRSGMGSKLLLWIRDLHGCRKSYTEVCTIIWKIGNTIVIACTEVRLSSTIQEGLYNRIVTSALAELPCPSATGFPSRSRRSGINQITADISFTPYRAGPLLLRILLLSMSHPRPDYCTWRDQTSDRCPKGAMASGWKGVEW